MATQERLDQLADLDQPTELRRDLNRGVAALFSAPEGYLRPRLSFNGRNGLAVLKGILSQGEDANTSYNLKPLVVVGDGRLWLNMRLSIFLDKIAFETLAQLTPRQTAWIVKEHLSGVSRAQVLESVKRWYLEEFRQAMTKSLEAISSQLVHGDPLVDSDWEGRIFDIHTQKPFPYTELPVVGEELVWQILYGPPPLMLRRDAWDRVDQIFARLL